MASASLARHESLLAAEDVFITFEIRVVLSAFGSKVEGILNERRRVGLQSPSITLARNFFFCPAAGQQYRCCKSDGTITASAPARSPNAISSKASYAVSAERSPNRHKSGMMLGANRVPNPVDKFLSAARWFSSASAQQVADRACILPYRHPRAFLLSLGRNEYMSSPIREFPT